MQTAAERIAAFILERESIRHKKESGGKRPWTDNEILAKYRFCNVQREDDKVTRWLKKHWRDPFAGHKNMTAALLLARMINWPPTLEWMGFPDKWDPERMVDCIHDIHKKGKAWSSAYIVSTCGEKIDKAVYVVRTASVVQGRPWYTPNVGDTLDSVWTKLRTVNGLGAGFIAAQVVADLKYCDESLMKAEDWWTWAVPGPGSRRGLNRYYGHLLESSWTTAGWQSALQLMINAVSPLIGRMELHAQDWQNCLCEWDKYERTRLGQGKPRAGYTPSSTYSV